MKYYTSDELISTLSDVTHVSLLNGKEGSISVISEYGGRPLGLFPRKNNGNLLWINPNVRETILSRGWDIGGDRYWISPEQLFFYEDPENWKGWFCPPSIDPANYKILEESSEACSVQSKITVINQINKEKYEGQINRTFKILKEPFSTDLEYCGLEILEECWLNQQNLKINGWSLATVISQGPNNPGTVLIPTKLDPKPLSYFRNIPNKRLILGENYVGFKIDVNDIYKLAIRPEDIDYEIPAKIGYVSQIPESQDYGFLVKLSNDIPRSQDDCYDISRDHPNMEIGVIQSYNSESPDKDNLNFGEIELQLSTFKTQEKTSIGIAKHQLFSYIGSKDEILTIVEKYLKIKNLQIFKK